MSKKALSLFQDDGTPEKLGGSPGVKSRDKKLRKSRNAEYYKQRYYILFSNFFPVHKYVSKSHFFFQFE